MIRRTFAFALAAAAALFVFTSSAQAQRARVGTLDCFSPGSVGFIVGSVTNFNCVFRPSNGGPGERYAGRIGRLGLDIGFTSSIRLVWAVFAETNYRRRALVGNYVGATAGAAVGVGGGANALVGGFRNSFSLQPLSFQADRGVNLQLTVTDFELR
jgi:hypothetical protein